MSALFLVRARSEFHSLERAAVSGHGQLDASAMHAWQRVPLVGTSCSSGPGQLDASAMHA
jgi:hypothetical protein